MQHVDNDMDDLFQRAAENYPLRIDEGDWESVASRISETSSPASDPLNKRLSKKILVTILILLIAIGWSLFEITKPSKNVVINYNNLANIKGNTKNKENKLALVHNTQKEKVINSSFKKIEKGHSNNILNSFSSNLSTGIANRTSTTFKGFKADIIIVNQDQPVSNVDAYNNNAPDKSSTKTLKDQSATESSLTPEDMNTNAKQRETIIPDAKNNLEKKNTVTKKETGKKQNIAFISNRKGFYIGVVAGPDFNKVESGSFAHTGFDAGLFFGYRFNSRLSLETGVLRENKDYTSSGNYFNMDKIRSTMPAGMIVNNLQSKSSLIEIPVKIKYDAIAKEKSNLFVAGGISAYVMTKEKNLYNVTLNGAQSKFDKVYTKNSYDIPAVANISIGYEYELSKHLQLRAEPFLKIPLQGVGVGSLPITSVGLQFGIISHLK